MARLKEKGNVSGHGNYSLCCPGCSCTIPHGVGLLDGGTITNESFYSIAVIGIKCYVLRRIRYLFGDAGRNMQIGSRS